MLFERIQNSRRAAVLVARVERQVDGLFARITDVKRVVLPQFLGGDIATGGCPSVWNDNPQSLTDAGTACSAAVGSVFSRGTE